MHLVHLTIKHNIFMASCIIVMSCSLLKYVGECDIFEYYPFFQGIFIVYISIQGLQETQFKNVKHTHTHKQNKNVGKYCIHTLWSQGKRNYTSSLSSQPDEIKNHLEALWEIIFITLIMVGKPTH